MNIQRSRKARSLKALIEIPTVTKITMRRILNVIKNELPSFTGVCECNQFHVTIDL